MISNFVTSSPRSELRAASPARLSLGRVGDGMPTAEVLRFGWAHATTRDAIHAALDVASLNGSLHQQGWETEHVRSRASDRAEYLRRPDLGRQLDGDDAARLLTGAARSGEKVACDICFIVADGLSCLAVQRHAVPLLTALRPLVPFDTTFSPVVIATQARVAIGDEIGEALGARLSIVLIGERPGLSSPDSLGIYLTYAPRKGRNDAQRNCISNVRPEGLAYEFASFKLAWLIRESQHREMSGVDLKEESHLDVLEAGASALVVGR